MISRFICRSTASLPKKSCWKRDAAGAPVVCFAQTGGLLRLQHHARRLRRESWLELPGHRSAPLNGLANPVQRQSPASWRWRGGHRGDRRRLPVLDYWGATSSPQVYRETMPGFVDIARKQPEDADFHPWPLLLSAEAVSPGNKGATG